MPCAPTLSAPSPQRRSVLANAAAAAAVFAAAVAAVAAVVCLDWAPCLPIRLTIAPCAQQLEPPKEIQASMETVAAAAQATGALMWTAD